MYRCWGITCYPCSKLCIGLLILLILLILAIIATFLILFIGKNKETQTTSIITFFNSTTEIADKTNTTVFAKTITIIPTKTIPTKSTTTTTTTTTTTASTATTTISCGTSCLNQSWIESSDGLAFWPFDGSYVDIVGNYNGIPSLNLPTFVPGYLGQAASFDASLQQA
ncbi:unnamed protein product, partial [Rotaria sp. Silwood1]